MTNREVLAAIASGQVNINDFQDLPEKFLKVHEPELSDVLAHNDPPRPTYYYKSYKDDAGNTYTPEQVMELTMPYKNLFKVHTVTFVESENKNAVHGVILRKQTKIDGIKWELKNNS